MHLTDKERKKLRKLLNKAWEKRDNRSRQFGWFGDDDAKRSARYRDVTRIIKEAEKAKGERGDGSDSA